MINKINKVLKHLVFLKGRPLLIIRIMKGYFNTLILRKPTLRSVELAITYRCNAKCEMCYSRNLNNKNKSEMSVDKIRELWKDCMKLGAIHVNITGGEPMLRKDVYDIIKALSPDRNIISLVTNASLIDENAIKNLKHAGLSTIQISIDDIDPKKHDKLRGIPNLYKKIIKSVKLAKKYGLVVCLSIVISHENIKSKTVSKLIKLAEDLDTFLLLNLVANAGGFRKKENILFNEEDNQFLQKLLQHPLTRQDTMFNFRLKPGCPAGTEKIYISSYGDVMPCDTTHVSFGNIFEEPLENIWKKMYNFSFYKMRSKLCLRHTNKEYINEFIKPTCNFECMPITIKDHPNKRFRNC